VTLLIAALGTRVVAQEPVSDPDLVEDAEAWGAPVELDEIGAGELLWRSDRGLVPLPALEVEVELDVTGVLVGGRVTQRFVNPTAETIEVVYAFPLPPSAAVHRMEMRIGERVVRSVIREREQARRTYEQAKATGRKAALLDRHRPNLFTTSAANINPGETIEIVLEYLDEVRYVDGSFVLSFPLAYVPRYVPAGFYGFRDEYERDALLGCEDVGGAIVPAAGIEVRLRPGIEVDRVESSSHAVRVDAEDEETLLVRTEEPRVPARRDFRLRWTPRLDGLPRPVTFVENGPGGRYAMLMLFPPLPGTEAGLGLPTETLFVLDVSGSMAGPSIRQARAALIAALDRLRPDDRFNILEFNETNRPFRPRFEFAEPETIEQARRWVRGLEAGGGTEIHRALVRGLEMMGESRSSHAQRIIFLTDGAVADEDGLLRTIAAELGDARLHAIGIGAAPNAYLMRKMARFGHGMCRFVDDAGTTENLIDAFFAKLDRPVATDLTLDWGALAVEESFPGELPDLHAGQPLALFARLAEAAETGNVRLTARTRAGRIETAADLPTVAERGSGLGIRWARSKVEQLMDSLHEGADPHAVRREVVDIALEFRLVTRYTSLVAVEEVSTALGEARPVRVAAVLPQGGTDHPLRLLVGLILLGTGTALLALLRR
jgi:Ca-activated chloride channel family protein